MFDSNNFTVFNVLFPRCVAHKEKSCVYFSTFPYAVYSFISLWKSESESNFTSYHLIRRTLLWAQITSSSFKLGLWKMGNWRFFCSNLLQDSTPTLPSISCLVHLANFIQSSKFAKIFTWLFWQVSVVSRDSVMFYGPALSERHVFEKVSVWWRHWKSRQS